MTDTTPLISAALADFVSRETCDTIPPAVRHRAKLLMLDAIGVAFASTRFDFARRALAALTSLGSGDTPVIGMGVKLGLRDAVLLNGILVHGLDYDDTYLPGSLHLSASCVPTVLGIATQTRASGRDLVTACTLGLETGARLGAAGNGGFLRAGFHATSIVGTFACTLAASRLLGLTPEQTIMAQGIALSMTSGNLQPMEDGAWTKRMHPGLSGASSITAATLAREGFVGPRATYEGRFGLFPCFLGKHFAGAELDRATTGLGTTWEFTRASIKLYPACHQSHAFFDAARRLATEDGVRPEDIVSIHALVAEPAVPLICEPLAAKRVPDTSYAAQFSLPYGIAACLVRGRFGLREIETESYRDAGLRQLARLMTYEVDPNSGFPRSRTGEVIVGLKDGRKLSRRASILPDEPAGEAEIVAKFMDNVALAMGPGRAARIRDAVLSIEAMQDAGELLALLGPKDDG
jgi:2-methylcitrate dehydratase PrpD